MRLVIREKILIVEETHDKKKEEVKPKISGEKKMCDEEVHLGFGIGLRFRKSDRQLSDNFQTS